MGVTHVAEAMGVTAAQRVGGGGSTGGAAGEAARRRGFYGQCGRGCGAGGAGMRGRWEGPGWGCAWGP